MRLLNTTTYELSDSPQDDGKLADYAILSHRWRGQEITYATLDSHALREGTPETAAAKKVVAACARAKQQGLDWIWIDSVCINKGDSSELSEALNVMLKWYRRSKVCYAYLDDVVAPETEPDSNTFKSCHPERAAKGANSEWFERGWTLQELLAPRNLEILDQEWQLVGTKHELADIVSGITGIDAAYLTGKSYFRDASVAARMSWQAMRTTTRIEDLAYSMLGIFSVSLSPIYGEGMNAFRRLQYAIIEQSDDESIFAWVSDNLPKPLQAEKWHSSEWGLLAPSPACFRPSGLIHTNGPVKRRGGGYKATQPGLELPIFMRQAGHYVASDLPVPNSKYDKGIRSMEFESKIHRKLIDKYAPPTLRLSVGSTVFVSLNCWRTGREECLALFAKVVSTEPFILKRTKCEKIAAGGPAITGDCLWNAIFLQPREDEWE